MTKIEIALKKFKGWGRTARPFEDGIRVTSHDGLWRAVATVRCAPQGRLDVRLKKIAYDDGRLAFTVVGPGDIDRLIPTDREVKMSRRLWQTADRYCRTKIFNPGN